MDPLPDLEIVPFRDELASAFAHLNRHWLEENGLLEAEDLVYLADPRGKIVSRGGEVLFALRGADVLGTVAILPLSAPARGRAPAGAVATRVATWELAKLAVREDARGLGLGRRLTLSALAFARAAGAQRVVLSSSSRLAAALRLYTTLGFCRVAAGEGVPYATADVFMELELATWVDPAG